MTLYDIGQRLQTVLAAIESGEIPEEAAADTLEGVQMEFSQKVENLACYIKERRAYAAAVKYEEDALAARRRALEAHADRLSVYLSRTMLARGMEKHESPRCAIRHSKSEGGVVDCPVDELPDGLVTIKRTPSLTAIKAALKQGQPVKAHIETRKNINIK